MQQANRRIRQLRIKSQDENSISADINALQDAFNIASMPGLPPNGLLLVKKLDLGVFRTRSTSISISKLIDEKIRNECYQPVCVDQRQSENKDVVWFSDTTEAVFALLKLVLNGQLPTAWYWPVIFPSLRKNPDLSEVLFTVSRDFPRSEIKPLVLVNTTRMLVLQTDIKTAFDVITLPLVQLMASEAGLYPRLVSTADTELKNWTVDLPVLSNPWEEAIKKAVQVWGEDDLRSHWLAYCALVTANPALIESKLIWPSIGALVAAMNLKENLYKYKSPVQQESHVGPFEKTAGQGEVSLESNEPLFLDHGKIESPNSIDMKNPLIIFPEQKQNLIENETNRNEIPNRPEVEFKFLGLINCRHSGFGFLIPLLGLLSIDQLLAKNPLLVEINFPSRILRLVANRLGIDSQHPLIQTLPEKLDSDKQVIENFVLPADWHSLFKSKKIFDSLFLRPTVNQLETIVQLLLSGFLYRHAKMSLRSLVIREGQIAVTRTHLDFLFNIDQLDIRVRKTGLDIDPGWVNWLGMVVQFHYQQKDGSDA
jgi:hypothetical protein